MSISTDIEVSNIRKYAELLKKKYQLQEQLSSIIDELSNLAIYMSNEDINLANNLFEDLMSD